MIMLALEINLLNTVLKILKTVIAKKKTVIENEWPKDCI